MSERNWHDPAFAADWDRDHLAGNPVRQQHLDLLLYYIEHLEPASVLDLGCGSGIVAEQVLDRVPGSGVVGLDGSRAMLNLARKRLRRFGERAQLVEADLTRLDALAGMGQFDTALAVQSLHHLELALLTTLLDRVAAALRPGGWLLVADRTGIAPESLYPAFRLYKERAEHHRNPASWDEYVADLIGSHDNPVTLERYIELLQEAGLDAGCVDCRGDRAFLIARRPA